MLSNDTVLATNLNTNWSQMWEIIYCLFHTLLAVLQFWSVYICNQITSWYHTILLNCHADCFVCLRFLAAKSPNFCAIKRCCSTQITINGGFCFNVYAVLNSVEKHPTLNNWWFLSLQDIWMQKWKANQMWNVIQYLCTPKANSCSIFASFQCYYQDK